MEQHLKQPAEERISVIDYLIVLLKRKRLIFLVTFLSALITAGVSLNMTEIYKAETRVLRPQQMNTGMTAQLMSQFGGAAEAAATLFGIGSPDALYAALLKSRPVQDNIIERFDLMKRYGARSMFDARDRLKDSMKVRVDSRSGLITVSVYDSDPQMAADLANAFVEELKNLTRNLVITEAAQRRAFFEEHLKEAKESLMKAEEKMAQFKARTGTLKIDEQAKAVISAIASLKAKIAEKEVQLMVLRSYSTPHNPDLQKVEEALRGLRAELKKMEKGEGKEYDPLMSTVRMPEVATEYVRLLRELKFSETLYDLFLKRYEAAKLNEASDALIVQVIEKAIPPEKRESPKRTRMVLIATACGFVFAILLSFVLEYRESVMNDPVSREKLERMKKYARFGFRK